MMFTRADVLGADRVEEAQGDAVEARADVHRSGPAGPIRARIAA
jgi:hypothetical protein